MSITITHYKLNNTSTDFNEPWLLEDLEINSELENVISHYYTNVEVLEPHEKSIQLFETEKDFNKYKAIFLSSSDFSDSNCKRIIEEKVEDITIEIENYIKTEKLNHLNKSDFKRTINGMNVHVITFGTPKLKKGFYVEKISELQKVENFNLNDKIKNNSLYVNKVHFELTYSLLNNNHKEIFKKDFLNKFEEGKSLLQIN